MYILKTFYKELVAILLLFAIVNCSKIQEDSFIPKVSIPVTAQNPEANSILGEGSNGFEVLGFETLKRKIKLGHILAAKELQASLFLEELAKGNPVDTSMGADAQPDAIATATEGSLTLGFPKGLLNENQVFGGVVTAVTDMKSEALGRLKLADLAPLHVRTLVMKNEKGKFNFTLVGCISKCMESSKQDVLISIPIVGVDETKSFIYLDLASIGEKLNLIEMLDPTGEATKLVTKSSKTVSLDYSYSTLVFDISTIMGPTETTFTSRWYLRLASAFNAAFIPRLAAEGVGFFMTERSLTPIVQRWTLPNETSVHYFIKNVPEEFKPAFAAAFDGWNRVFTNILGKNLLSYEFVDFNDPRNAFLVTGDVRYKIIEWDLVNRAPYGGLGPSIANQFTGEMLSANILVQGPHIVKIYKEWFTANQDAELLRGLGQNTAAQARLRTTQNKLREELEDGLKTSFELNVNSKLKFSIHSQRTPLEDPIMQRDDFEPIPPGVTLKSYMQGYFEDLVAHELGHNLGLRHNFRGNLGAKEGVPSLGKVSLSVMEYLGRGFRFLDKIGEYDEMALKYGYLGILPNKTGQFCTDDEVADFGKNANSAECSRDDATIDPFSFFEKRLTRVIDLLTLRGTELAPIWKVDDLARELGVAVTGMGLYAQTAEKTGMNWTNFFGKKDRPESTSGVEKYVIESLKNQLCDSRFVMNIEQKVTPEAKLKTKTNINSMQEKADEILRKFTFLGNNHTLCLSPN